MPPRFLGGECENRCEQPAECVEDFVHCDLRRAAAWRIRCVAIHPVFGDVDVKAAQVYRAKLIERMIDFVKLERFVSSSTICDHVIESLQDPAID